MRCATARCLLVVDNCEHLIEAAAAIIDLILAQAPRRTGAHHQPRTAALIGEAICPLPPLTQPPVTAEPPNGRLSRRPALADRARVVRPDSSSTPKPSGR